MIWQKLWTFNRTTMELKLENRYFYKMTKQLLIVPLWN